MERPDCYNCKHCIVRQLSTRTSCAKTPITEYQPTRGGLITTDWKSTDLVRTNEAMCGLDGKWFEHKHGWWRAFINNLRELLFAPSRLT